MARIGREIVEVEQLGEARAGYAEELLIRLAARLSKDFGKGMGARSLRRIRQFYLTYVTGSQLPPEIWTTVLSEFQTIEFPPFLTWSHFLVLMKVANPRLSRDRAEAERALERDEAQQGTQTSVPSARRR